MSATIRVKCLVANPGNIPPDPGLAATITVSQFFGFVSSNPGGVGFQIPDLRNGKRFTARFTGSISAQVSDVVNTGVPYFVEASTPGAEWGGDKLVTFISAGPFQVVDGKTTAITLQGNLQQVPH